jgi:drug/metabolite transporter (DMT)-like permease
MSLTVFVAILFAALLHATWNALIKLDADKLTAMLIMTLVQGGIGVLVALGRPLPQGEVWIWLLASGFIHSVYKIFLQNAFHHGDLSRVYPIARGAAPMIVALVGFFLLSDRLSGVEQVGIAVLGAGIILIARGVFTNGESRRLLPFALGSAFATAAYSLVDGMGARVSGDAVTYVAWLFIFDAVLFGLYAITINGSAALKASRRSWLMASVASAASYGAYAIAVWAMTVAPIALVTALRETSILFAVLIGWLAFGDRMDRGKAMATTLIVAGVVLTRL